MTDQHHRPQEDHRMARNTRTLESPVADHEPERAPFAQGTSVGDLIEMVGAQISRYETLADITSKTYASVTAQRDVATGASPRIEANSRLGEALAEFLQRLTDANNQLNDTVLSADLL